MAEHQENTPNLEVQLGFTASVAASLTALVWFAMDGARSVGVHNGAAYLLGALACGAMLAAVVDMAIFLGLRSMWMAWAMAREEDADQVDDQAFDQLYRRGSGWFADAVGRLLRWVWWLLAFGSVKLADTWGLGAPWVALCIAVGALARWGDRVRPLRPLPRLLRRALWDGWRLPGAPTGWRRVVDRGWSLLLVLPLTAAVFVYTLPPLIRVTPTVLSPQDTGWVRVELTALRGPQTEVHGRLDGSSDLDFARVGDVFLAPLSRQLSEGPHEVSVQVHAHFDTGEQFSVSDKASFLVAEGSYQGP